MSKILERVAKLSESDREDYFKNYLKKQNNELKNREENKNNFLKALVENDLDQVKNLMPKYLELELGDGEWGGDRFCYLDMAINAGCNPHSKESFLYYMDSCAKKSINLVMLSITHCFKIKYYEMIHHLLDKYPKAWQYIELMNPEYDFDKLFSPEYNFNKISAVECAIRMNKIDFIKDYIDDLHMESREYLLCNAIVSDNIEIAQLLINYGADANTRAEEHLESAFKNNNLEMVQLLIDAGIDLKKALRIDNLKPNPMLALLVNNGIDPMDLATSYHNKSFNFNLSNQLIKH